jgi:hypothetical protein
VWGETGLGVTHVVDVAVGKKTCAASYDGQNSLPKGLRLLDADVAFIPIDLQGRRRIVFLSAKHGFDVFNEVTGRKQRAAGNIGNNFGQPQRLEPCQLERLDQQERGSALLGRSQERNC